MFHAIDNDIREFWANASLKLVGYRGRNLFTTNTF